MVVGSGLLAKVFASYFAHTQEHCVYAAGVSNSNCTDEHEFSREHERLQFAMNMHSEANLFLYFSTCSIEDSDKISSPYVMHKIRMEELVLQHPNYLIIRLPQVVGRTPNPHTLINHLYNRISRSERVVIWKNAKRNIIDVSDVAKIAYHIIVHEQTRNEQVNIANAMNNSIEEIVEYLGNIVGKKVHCKYIDGGGQYNIDISRITDAITKCGINFSDNYLERVLIKYYENRED